MSLTRYLPAPSDRMGILWSLLNIEDAVILEYSTAGTTTYAMRVFSQMGIDVSNKLFTTHMGENDIIMGDTSKLEDAILTLDKKLSPKVIFVMGSSITSVTGSDVKGVCTYIEEKISAKIITFTQGGFSGDFSSGIKSAYTDIISNLCTDKLEIEENSYNIIGLSAIDETSRYDVNEIQKMMKNYFDMDANAILSLNTNIDKIKTMSKAKLNLVLSYEGLQAAKILQERFGTPYVYGLPIGYKGTLNWLLDISKLTNKTLDDDIIQKLSNIPKLANNDKRNKVAIYSSYDYTLSLQSFMKELGMESVFLLSTHRLNKIQNRNKDVLYLKKEKEKIDLFEQLNNTFILGDCSLINHADDSNYKLSISKSISEFSPFSYNNTLVGLKGAENIYKSIEDFMCK